MEYKLRNDKDKEIPLEEKLENKTKYLEKITQYINNILEILNIEYVSFRMYEKEIKKIEKLLMLLNDSFKGLYIISIMENEDILLLKTAEKIENMYEQLALFHKKHIDIFQIDLEKGKRKRKGNNLKFYRIFRYTLDFFKLLIGGGITDQIIGQQESYETSFKRIERERDILNNIYLKEKTVKMIKNQCNNLIFIKKKSSKP